MITLYIVRHGHCTGNIDGFIQGQLDSPLTELGLRQAEAVADRLANIDFSAIYSSDLSRTRATAEAIASKHGLKVQTTELIREAHLGRLQGMTETEFCAQFPESYSQWRQDPINHRPPEAEKFEDVIARSGLFLNMIKKAHSPGEQLAVVVHVGSLRGLICAACNLPVSSYLSFFAANASLSILDIGDRCILRLLNDSCHIQNS